MFFSPLLVGFDFSLVVQVKEFFFLFLGEFREREQLVDSVGDFLIVHCDFLSEEGHTSHLHAPAWKRRKTFPIFLGHVLPKTQYAVLQ